MINHNKYLQNLTIINWHGQKNVCLQKYSYIGCQITRNEQMLLLRIIKQLRKHDQHREIDLCYVYTCLDK